MTTKLITTDMKLHIANQIKESVNEVSNTAYYLFVCNHIDRENSIVPNLTGTINDTIIDPYKNMLYGKRLSNNDVSILIRNIPYELNKSFDMYDDQDDELFNKDYYCIVNASSYYHVFKCLDNNGGANSTVEPDFSHINGSNTITYRTSDNYSWKYMYSISSAKKSKFSTADYFPVEANNDVVNQANVGAIDVIKINDGGKYYNNYVTGSFVGSDIRIGGNNRIFAISNSSVSTTNGYYTGCIIYISTGTGAGQYKKVSHYYSSNLGNYIVVNSAFDTIPENGSGYEIYPEVVITGTGSETSNAVARALINSTSSNSVYRVEILERGSQYNTASANVIANAVVGISLSANLRVINSPFDGHGSSPEKEFGGSHIGFSVQFSNSESNTIPITNKFQQIGILKDPYFANVNFELTNVISTFISGETIYKISPVKLNTNLTINLYSTEISCSNCGLNEQISAGDYIYLQGSNASVQQISVVNSVTNSSHAVIASNSLFSCTEVLLYNANTTTNCVITNLVDISNFRVSNVAGIYETNNIIIGMSSGAKATINSISRNDVSKGFETFIQMYKYEGNVISGTFEENEIVYQTNLSTSNASLHSIINNGSTKIFYTSNQSGIFNVESSNSIIGNTSGAVANLTGRYLPELTFNSGEILYLENIDPVTKGNSNNVFKIIIGF